MFFVSCWFVFLIILVSLSQFTERKTWMANKTTFPTHCSSFQDSILQEIHIITELFSFPFPPFLFSLVLPNFFTPTKTLSQHVQMHLFFSIIPFLRTFLYNQNLHLCASCSHPFFIQLLYYPIHEATQSIFSFPTILLYLNNIWQMHVVFIPTLYMYIHTYTCIYFIYAQNTQCSCKANIFKKLS